MNTPPHPARATRVRWLPPSIVLAFLLATIVGTAAAHTALTHAEPARGSTVRESPRRIALTFTEAISLAVSRIRLFGPDSVEITLGAVRHPVDSARTIVVDVGGPLRPGRHIVRWQVAGEDGHPIHGEYAFELVTDSAASAPPAAAVGASDTSAAAQALPSIDAFDVDSPLFAAVRWIDYAALMGLIGAVLFRLLVLTRLARSSSAYDAALLPTLDRGAARFGVIAGGTLIVALILALLAQSRAAHGAEDMWDPSFVRGMLTSTQWGFGWMLRFAAALLGTAGLALARRARAGEGLQGWGMAVIAMFASVIGQPYMGHSAAAPSLRGLALLADGIHILGAGGWLGTLLVMVVVGLAGALRLDPPERASAAAAIVRTFSPVALTCAGAVLMTGLFAAIMRLGSVGAIVGSRYGVTLLVKLALVALIALVGAINWRRLTPRLTGEESVRRIRRSATIELAIGALIVAVTAVLVTTSPPAYEPEPPANTAPTTFDRQLDSLTKTR